MRRLEGLNSSENRIVLMRDSLNSAPSDASIALHRAELRSSGRCRNRRRYCALPFAGEKAAAPRQPAFEVHNDRDSLPMVHEREHRHAERLPSRAPARRDDPRCKGRCRGRAGGQIFPARTSSDVEMNCTRLRHNCSLAYPFPPVCCARACRRGGSIEEPSPPIRN